MHKMCAEMEVIMGKEKSIGKRKFYEIKFLKRLMMFGVVAAAAVTMLMQTDNASAAKKKTKQTQECEDDYLPSAFFGGTSHSLKKVKFTTAVDFDIVGRVAQSQNFQVAANDSKYKSVDGMIYTKNGKTLVGIPYGRKKIVISDKCTAVSTKSYWYGIETQWKWGEIIFPNTITKVIDEWNGEFFDYGYTGDTYASNKKEIKVILNMKYLDRDSIKNLWQSNSRWRNSLKDELIRKGLAKLNEENERMLMLEDGYLCSYLVKEGVDINNYKTWKIVSRLVIPDNVKTIGSGAFTQCYVRSLILGSGVMYIEDNSIQAEPDEEPEAYTGSTKIYVKRPDISISDNAFINGDKVKVIIEQ